ncbi:MAG: hypothetical protein NUW02_00795 [Candidatus Campbellbacteria bacterium]|nr:hypothetical protein [Candidatus Campbellbacteria bacterium]
MDLLAKLFGGSAPVRLMRFFLFHPEGIYGTATLAEKTSIVSSSLKTPLARLKSAGFLKKRARGWLLNPEFPHMMSVKHLMLGNMLADVPVVSRVSKCGALKLLVVSGIFIEEEDSRTDVLVIADRIDDKALAKAITQLEAECGTDIRYSAFSTKDFSYRTSMNDKLLRDVFDYPHRKLVNKLGL